MGNIQSIFDDDNFFSDIMMSLIMSAHVSKQLKENHEGEGQ